ncbi:hypothetical protein [Nonomuraea dietziae]|uniref:hypothetical protein n=1 Tax=Nonomuraea dietziae TaxID=65515 RepID=UPI0034175705
MEVLALQLSDLDDLRAEGGDAPAASGSAGSPGTFSDVIVITFDRFVINRPLVGAVDAFVRSLHCYLTNCSVQRIETFDGI